MTMYNTTQLQTIAKDTAPNGATPNALTKLIYDSKAVEAVKSKAKASKPTTTVVQDVEIQTQAARQAKQAEQLALTVPPQVLQEAAQMQMAQMQAPQGAPGPTAPQGIAGLPPQGMPPEGMPQGMPQGMPPQQTASLDQGVGGLPDTGIDQNSFAGGGIVAFSGATDGSVVGAGERDYTDYGAGAPRSFEDMIRGLTEEQKQELRAIEARKVTPDERAAYNTAYPTPGMPPQPMEQLTDQAPLPEGTSERSGNFGDMRIETQRVRAGGNDFNQQLGGINALPEASEMTASDNVPAAPAEAAPGAQYFPQAEFGDFSKQTGGQGVASLPEAAAVPTPTPTPTAPQGKVPKTVRYNNPLALWDTKTNDLRKYDTYEEGKAAGQRDLDIKLAGKSAIFNSRFPDGIVTPERLAEVWSPAKGVGNSKVATEAYGRYIASYLGIKPTDPIPPGKNAQVFEVMSQFESGIRSGKGAFKQSPTVVDPRDGGIRQLDTEYVNKKDPTITHDFSGTPGVAEKFLAAITGSKNARGAENNPDTKGHPTYKEETGTSFKQAKKGETRENIYPNLQDMGDAAHDVFSLVPRAGVGIVNTGIEALNKAHIPYSPYRFKIPSIPTDNPWLDSKTMTPFADRRNVERGKYDQYGNELYTPKPITPEAPEAPEAEEAKGSPSATTKQAKPVKAAWDQQSILDRAGDYQKYMGVNPQIEQASKYASGKTEQADKAEKNRMYDLMIRGGTQAALAAAKPGSGRGLAGLMNAASHGAAAAADQNQVLTDRISALRKEGFDTKKDAAAAQRAEKVSALKFAEDAYHHAGTIAASFEQAKNRAGSGRAAAYRAHAQELVAFLKEAQKDMRSLTGDDKSKASAKAVYDSLYADYQELSETARRLEAEESGDVYKPRSRVATTETADPAASLKVTRREK